MAIQAEAKAIVAKKLADQQDTGERAAIAKTFNDRYTYRYEYVKGMPSLPGTGMFGTTPNGGYAWMCPVCNKIHMATECSVFDGIHYPRCCNTGAGNRCSAKIKYNDEGNRT